MNIKSVATAMKMTDEYKNVLTEEEKSFIAYFAYQTEDMELTQRLIERLVGLEEGTARRNVIECFEDQLYKQPKAIRQMEELLVSIERYRIEEQKAINELSNILASYNISVLDEELKKKEAEMTEKVIEAGKVR